jgi:hypothetical protein
MPTSSLEKCKGGRLDGDTCGATERRVGNCGSHLYLEG